MARRYLLPGDYLIARIECDIDNGRDGENVLARQKRHDITSELNHTARVWFDALHTDMPNTPRSKSRFQLPFVLIRTVIPVNTIS